MSNVHTTHCCIVHGCKYNDDDCPVANGDEQQEYSCELCGYTKEPAWEKVWARKHSDRKPESISDTIATLATDALVTAGLIRRVDFQKAEEIIEEETRVRLVIEGHNHLFQEKQEWLCNDPTCDCGTQVKTKNKTGIMAMLGTSGGAEKSVSVALPNDLCQMLRDACRKESKRRGTSASKVFLEFLELHRDHFELMAQDDEEQDGVTI